MWFPTFFTKFMPGWVLNIALIIRSDEALLAAGFIFSIYFFNTHFRIEKFPMDTVIFSGRISKNEMLHERKRWYNRLVATGQLEEHGWRWLALFFHKLKDWSAINPSATFREPPQPCSGPVRGCAQVAII
jgi:hypothetical protein